MPSLIFYPGQLPNISIQVLYYYPGQKATMFLGTTDETGARTDSPTTPAITRVVFPDFSLASGFPQNMTKLDTGLYYFQITLPKGTSSIGSYFVDAEFTNPATSVVNNTAYQLIISSNFSNFSVSPA